MRTASAGMVALAVYFLPALCAAADSAARAFALEQDRLARDPALLRVAGHDFDPLARSACPDDDRAALCGVKEVAPPAAGDAATWLVQATGRAMDARPALAAAGVDVLGYFPNEAWLVRAPASRIADVARLPAVRWVGAWSPAWKAAPGLLTRAPRQGEAELALRVELQPGARIAPWKAELEATPGATIVSARESATEPTFATIELTLIPEDAASAVRWLASLRDVARIEERATPVLALDASVPWGQTGIDAPNDYDLTAKLFAKGVTGRGILVGISDDGLENDDCRFVYDHAIDEAAWPLGPSATDPSPVIAEGHFAAGQPPPVRTRERKVVAYYLQSGADAYSSPAQHGAHVAGCIAGDAHDVLAARPLIRDVGDLQDVRPMSPSGDWMVGQALRLDLEPSVDNPAVSEPQFPTTYGSRVQHHEAGDGTAPGAQLVFQDIGTAADTLVSPDLEAMMAQAHGSGATGYNVSWGDPTSCSDCYSGWAEQADRALWRLRDLSAAASVGNAGYDGAQSVMGGAAHAKSPVVVGATVRANSPSCASCVPPGPRKGEDRAEFSSIGPSSGGRIAPEVMAPGIVLEPYADGVTPEDGTGSGEFGCPRSLVMSGTSFSTGTVSGLGALVQQYFRDGYYPSGSPDASMRLRPTNALVRAVLVNSARDLVGLRTDEVGTGIAHRPNFSVGWGAPRLDDTLFFSGDPTSDDPLGDTERSRLVVLTDTPNGFDGMHALAPEPGGRTRDQIVASFQQGLTDGATNEFMMNVINPDPSSPANELRITLAWSDVPGLSESAPLVNDLDLEVISPGPDGILQTATGPTLRGDDRVYRTNPLVAWSGGYSQPSTTPRLQSVWPPFDATLADADRLNTVENVFVRSSAVVNGTWRIRVIGYNVRSSLSSPDGRPNFALGDRPAVIDVDGDTIADLDVADGIRGSYQGYALIASGSFLAPAFSLPRLPAPPRHAPRPPGRHRGSE